MTEARRQAIYLVTGGAGFIGSNIVAALAGRGERVAVCDRFGSESKWRNLAKYDVYDFVEPAALGLWWSRHAGRIAAVIHMGAISATTEHDADLILEHNFRFSKQLWDWCAGAGATFIYASSAAVYGDGGHGFDDAFDEARLARLRPLNPYGWSKLAFDRRVLRAVSDAEAAPPKWAGLRFFNVFGPNEYHKAGMRSVIAANFDSIRSGAPLRLFRSYRADYADGGQQRDFVYVEDCVATVIWMLERDFPSSIYNIGSGVARSWLEMGEALFAALEMPARIEFIDMPERLREHYQYFTRADTSKLRSAGYCNSPRSLESAVRDYVTVLRRSDRYR